MGYMGNRGGDIMNQTSRVVKDKCKFCGRVVYLEQEYDKTLSEYVTVGVPICIHCWGQEIICEKRCTDK